MQVKVVMNFYPCGHQIQGMADLPPGLDTMEEITQKEKSNKCPICNPASFLPTRAVSISYKVVKNVR